MLQTTNQLCMMCDLNVYTYYLGDVGCLGDYN